MILLKFVLLLIIDDLFDGHLEFQSQIHVLTPFCHINNFMVLPLYHSFN